MIHNHKKLFKLDEGYIIKTGDVVSNILDSFTTVAFGKQMSYIDDLTVQDYLDACVFKVIIADDLRSASYHRFRDVQHISSFFATNIKSSGGMFEKDVRIVIYLDIDDSLPKISRIYGKNALYAMLRGRGQYKNRTSCLLSMNHPFIPAMLRAICVKYRTDMQLHNKIGIDDKALQCFWFPTKYTRYDGFMRDNAPIEITYVRSMISTTGDLDSAIGISTSMYANTGMNKNTGVATLRHDMTVNVDDIANVAHKSLLEQLSSVAIYPVEYNDISKNRIMYAFYIRPLFQDSFYFDYVSTGAYDIYTITFGAGKSIRLHKLVIDGTISASQRFNSIGPFRISRMMPRGFTPGVVGSMNQYQMPKIKIALRSKITGRFSELSETAIKFLIERDNYRRISITVE